MNILGTLISVLNYRLLKRRKYQNMLTILWISYMHLRHPATHAESRLVHKEATKCDYIYRDTHIFRKYTIYTLLNVYHSAYNINRCHEP